MEEDRNSFTKQTKTLVQVRGTSGSGKSTVIKTAMGILERGRKSTWQSVYVDGRRKPILYVLDNIVVLGHYEIDCGGCDTIGSAPKVFELVTTLSDIIPDVIDVSNLVVLSEGLLWGEDVKWTQNLLSLGWSVVSMFLNTSLEDCLAGVESRQNGKEPKEPERVVRKLTARMGTIDRARVRLLRTKCKVLRVSRQQALKRVLTISKEN